MVGLDAADPSLPKVATQPKKRWIRPVTTMETLLKVIEPITNVVGHAKFSLSALKKNQKCLTIHAYSRIHQ